MYPEDNQIPDNSTPQDSTIPDSSTPQDSTIPESSSPQDSTMPDSAATSDYSTYQEVPPTESTVSQDTADYTQNPQFDQYQQADYNTPHYENNQADYNTPHYENNQPHFQYHPNDNYQRDHFTGTPHNPKPVSGMSIATLIMGVLSIVCCCCGIGGIIFGAVGIILAVLSRANEPMQTNAKIGLGLSITGLVLGFIVTIMFFVAGQSNRDYSGALYQFEKRYSNDYSQPSTDNDIVLPYSDSLSDLMHQDVNQDF